MDFETFWAGFNTPPPTTINIDSQPVEVLRYITDKGLLALDIDFIDDYLLKVTPTHPDEWEYDEHCVGEIEDFRDRAIAAQDHEEGRWLAAVNNPDHPDHKAEWDKLNK
jgi:hypothetical protein